MQAITLYGDMGQPIITIAADSDDDVLGLLDEYTRRMTMQADLERLFALPTREPQPR